MSLFESEAVVLKTTKVGDYDRIVTFYTMQRGKINAATKIYNNKKNSISARIESFAYSNVIFFAGKEKNNILKISSIDTINPLINLRTDLNKISKAFIAIESVNISQPVMMSDENIFNELVWVLESLAKESEKKSEVLLRIFQIRLLTYTGIFPRFFKCELCKDSQLKSLVVYFDIYKRIFICHKCVKNYDGKIKISKGVIEFIKKVISLARLKLGIMAASDKFLLEIKIIIEELISNNFQKRLNSEKISEMIKIN